MINIYDSKSFQKTNTLKGHEKGVWCSNYSTTESLLATGSNDTKAMLWDTRTYKTTNTLSAHTDTVIIKINVNIIDL